MIYKKHNIVISSYKQFDPISQSGQMEPYFCDAHTLLTRLNNWTKQTVFGSRMSTGWIRANTQHNKSQVL